jgi:3-methylcrotonyl-CoA carboxylase alpha subunit
LKDRLKPFDRVLIANRGEIACRVMRTCRRLGIVSIAVYSEADADARHVRLADEALCIGPAASRESYLCIDAIIGAARRSGAQAIHPGYGFLAENETFARACEEEGLVFIGPSPDAIRAMGSKSAAKALMQEAGVPLVPGYHGAEQAPDFLRSRAATIGYPMLIKASAGGGGKGMRLVDRDEDFLAALAACQREARASFGDDRVLIEKYLERPRHIEVQVFGDRHGSIINLFERDCSMQRRHQKVVEEAPAPGMTPERREAIGRAACAAARAVGYVGAGTVEFIAEQSGEFYFMEMNTRLQVEHPVTEMITGLDLVEWQLRVAAGEPLPLRQEQVPLRGHAIEVRLYAEEPERGFLPSTGRLTVLDLPPESAHVRVDTGVEQGDDVTPHYDPMLAKLIVWDETRHAAIERMLWALGELHIAGVGSNRRFLSRLIAHEDFRDARIDTGLIEREREALLSPQPVPLEILHTAALWLLMEEAVEAVRASPDPRSPWAIADGWRLGGYQARRVALQAQESLSTLEVRYVNGGWLIDGIAADLQVDDDRRLRVRLGERQFRARVARVSDRLYVSVAGESALVKLIDPLQHAGDEVAAHGGLTAPMPGKILELLAEAGSEVEEGTPLVVMEAMKMEHTVRAPCWGRVRAFLCKVGAQVNEGDVLVDFGASSRRDASA